MSTPLLGLVLVGGQSRRMGRDKALLCYDGQTPQIERTVELLKPLCQQVFVSQRETQSFELPQETDPIFDSVNEAKGPLCGILSAMRYKQKVNWLVLACDLPNVDRPVLTKLISHFEADSSKAAAYRNSADGLPEPLCAIYPATLHEELRMLNREQGIQSPQKMLSLLRAHLIDQDKQNSLDNVNTQNEFAAFTKQ